jgi:hypothetical protein
LATAEDRAGGRSPLSDHLGKGAKQARGVKRHPASICSTRSSSWTFTIARLFGVRRGPTDLPEYSINEHEDVLWRDRDPMSAVERDHPVAGVLDRLGGRQSGNGYGVWLDELVTCA